MIMEAPPRLDIVIPVYKEGANILSTLQSFARAVKTPLRVLICYDCDDDDTLSAIESNRAALVGLAIVCNRGCGVHGAVVTGFADSETPYAVVVPADDDYNAGIIDVMVAAATKGCDIVRASRFIAGGSMVGCPWLEAFNPSTDA